MIAAQVAYALLIAAAGSHAGAVQQRLIWPDISATTELFAGDATSVEFCFQGHVRNDAEKWTLNLEQSSWFGAKYDLKANFKPTTDQCFEANFTVPAQAKTAHNYRFRLVRSRAWWFNRNYNPSEQFSVWSTQDAERIYAEAQQNIPVARDTIDAAIPVIYDEPMNIDLIEDEKMLELPSEDSSESPSASREASPALSSGSAGSSDSFGWGDKNGKKTQKWVAALESRNTMKIKQFLYRPSTHVDKIVAVYGDQLLELALEKQDYELLGLLLLNGSATEDQVRAKAYDMGFANGPELDAVIDAVALFKENDSKKRQ